eukprot:GSA120T00010506001.1
MTKAEQIEHQQQLYVKNGNSHQHPHHKQMMEKELDTLKAEIHAAKQAYITWHLIWFIERTDFEGTQIRLDLEREEIAEAVATSYSGSSDGGKPMKTEADFLKEAFATSQSYRNFVGVLRWLRWVYKSECDFNNVSIYKNPNTVHAG